MTATNNTETNTEEQSLLERAGYILAMREHGRLELRRKLLHPRKKDVTPPPVDLVDTVLDRLEELGLLDDGRYARQAAEQLTRKGLSATGVRRELLARGVEQEAVEAALPPAEEDATRLEALLRQPTYARKLASERGRRSVFQALLRRGYRHGEILRAMDITDNMDE
ncbi:MAG: recombination regulator RecX [Oscillospiraceae bacterium]|nr:recombination regulator RecX [Oscillospiraceae bacterium]